jgi:hypothetical protein
VVNLLQSDTIDFQVKLFLQDEQGRTIDKTTFSTKDEYEPSDNDKKYYKDNSKKC